MVPLEPRQGGAVWRHDWIRVEVGAGDQRHARRRPRRTALRPIRARDVDRHDGRGRLGVALAVILSHGDQPSARGVHAGLGKEPPLGRQRDGGAAFRLQVETLIGEVREVHVTAVHGHRGAAVLVDTRACVEARRCDVHGRPIERALHDDVASALGRPSLGPVHIVAVEDDVAQPQRPSRDPCRGQRRRPRAVRRLGLRVLRVLLHTPRRNGRHEQRPPHRHTHLCAQHYPSHCTGWLQIPPVRGEPSSGGCRRSRGKHSRRGTGCATGGRKRHFGRRTVSMT